MPVATRAVSRHLPSSSQAKRWSLVSATFIRFRHVINGSLTFVFPAHTWRVHPAFSETLTTAVIGPPLLSVVWTLTLQSESEGPALISYAARLHRVDRITLTVSSLRRRGAHRSANAFKLGLRAEIGRASCRER